MIFNEKRVFFLILKFNKYTIYYWGIKRQPNTLIYAHMPGDHSWINDPCVKYNFCNCNWVNSKRVIFIYVSKITYLWFQEELAQNVIKNCLVAIINVWYIGRSHHIIEQLLGRPCGLIFFSPSGKPMKLSTVQIHDERDYFLPINTILPFTWSSVRMYGWRFSQVT